MLRASGALLLIVQGWWWCFVLGLRIRTLPAIGLTALLAAIGAILGQLGFEAIAAAVR